MYKRAHSPALGSPPRTRPAVAPLWDKLAVQVTVFPAVTAGAWSSDWDSKQVGLERGPNPAPERGGGGPEAPQGWVKKKPTKQKKKPKLDLFRDQKFQK